MEHVTTKKRIGALDALRGLALLNMIAFHGLYDWIDVFGHAIPGVTLRAGAGDIWQQSICWTFILLAGISYNFSRAPLRHGLVLLGCSAVLTAVTAIVTPDQLIVFGILHFLSVATLLTLLLAPLLNRAPAGVACVGSFVLFLLCKGVPEGFVGVGGYAVARLPLALYSQRWTFWLGLPDASFFSADYFPLIPWLFLFWTGLYLWRWCGVQLTAILRRVPDMPFLEWAGRHSLWIYMLHQPVLMLILLVLNAMTA
jgi:uncharacterized membrane protein